MLATSEENDNIKPAHANIGNGWTSGPPNENICDDDTKIFSYKEFRNGNLTHLGYNPWERVASPLISHFTSDGVYILEEEQLERDRRLSRIPEGTTNQFLTVLIARIIAKDSPQNKNIIIQLAQLAQVGINPDESGSKKDKKKMKKIQETTFKNISRDLLEAATALHGPSFDEALLSILQFHLNAAAQPKKKSKVARFFSRLGRVLIMPFRWRTRGNQQLPPSTLPPTT